APSSSSPAAGGPVREWSAGQYSAVYCTDYPQAFDMRASLAVRQAQYQAAVEALSDDTFAPFSVQEWTTSPVAEFDDCLHWPAPVRDDPPITPAPRAPPLGFPGPPRASTAGPADPAGAGPVGRARHPDPLDRRRHRGQAAGPVGPLGPGRGTPSCGRPCPPPPARQT